MATVQPDGRPHQSVVWIARDGDRGDRGGDALRDALARKYTGHSYAEHKADAAARYGTVPVTVVRVTPTQVMGRL